MQIPQEILDRAATFSGQCPALERALGAYVLGQMYGWRGLYMCHSQSTLRTYEKTLGVSFADCCPERTNLSNRIRGIKIADKLGAFWKVVRGSAYRAVRGRMEEDTKQASLL